MSEMLKEIKRKMLMTIGLGTLEKINDSAPIQKVQVAMLENEIHTDYDRMQEYGFTSVPIPGSQAVIVCVGGSRDNGVSIASDDRRYRLKDLEPGEVAIYDIHENFIKLRADGTIVIKSFSNVRIEAPTVTMTGNLTVNGNITAQGNITDQTSGTGRSMASMRSVYNTHTHPGDSGGTTGSANQPM